MSRKGSRKDSKKAIRQGSREARREAKIKAAYVGKVGLLEDFCLSQAHLTIDIMHHGVGIV